MSSQQLTRTGLSNLSISGSWVTAKTLLLPSRHSENLNSSNDKNWTLSVNKYISKINTCIMSIYGLFSHWLEKKGWCVNHKNHTVLSIVHIFILYHLIATITSMILEPSSFTFYRWEYLGTETLNILSNGTS